MTPKKKPDIFEQQAKQRLEKRKKRHLQERKPYQKKRVLIPAFLMVVLIIGGIYGFINSLRYQSTDDAFVEGRLVSIAPKVSGQIINLYVNDNDYVGFCKKRFRQIHQVETKRTLHKARV